MYQSRFDRLCIWFGSVRLDLLIVQETRNISRPCSVCCCIHMCGQMCRGVSEWASSQLEVKTWACAHGHDFSNCTVIHNSKANESAPILYSMYKLFKTLLTSVEIWTVFHSFLVFAASISSVIRLSLTKDWQKSTYKNRKFDFHNMSPGSVYLARSRLIIVRLIYVIFFFEFSAFFSNGHIQHRDCSSLNVTCM